MCNCILLMLWYVLPLLTILCTFALSYYEQVYKSQKVCISGPMFIELFSLFWWVLPPLKIFDTCFLIFNEMKKQEMRWFRGTISSFMTSECRTIADSLGDWLTWVCCVQYLATRTNLKLVSIYKARLKRMVLFALEAALLRLHAIFH